MRDLPRTRLPFPVCLYSSRVRPWGAPGSCASPLWSSNRGPPNTGPSADPKALRVRGGTECPSTAGYMCVWMSGAKLGMWTPTCVRDCVCANIQPSVPFVLSPSLCQLNQWLFSRRFPDPGTTVLQPASGHPDQWWAAVCMVGSRLVNNELFRGAQVCPEGFTARAAPFGQLAGTGGGYSCPLWPAPLVPAAGRGPRGPSPSPGCQSRVRGWDL